MKNIVRFFVGFAVGGLFFYYVSLFKSGYDYINCASKIVAESDSYLKDMKKLYRSKTIGMDQAYFYLNYKSMECRIENL